jgi:HEAT repeat protein
MTATMEPMPAEQSVLLAEFARSCKAAARAVSLYPGTHPAIGVSLSRLVSSTSRLTRDGAATLAVHRDLIAIDGRAPLRPDPAIAELAALMHDRLIGVLTVQREATIDDWRALLLLLARAPEDLRADGGIGDAWTRTGRGHFLIQEIDYAEVLREKGGGEEAEWDRIISFCLRGSAESLDDRALASLLEALGDPARFARLLDRLEDATGGEETKVAARVAALLQLMRAALDAARARGDAEAERALQTMAASCAGLTPEVMIALLDRRQSENAAEAATARAVVEHITEPTMSSFVARSVAAEQGATDRLAHALDALAADTEQKRRVVDLARAEALQGELGTQDGFEQMWQGVTDTVMSHTMMSYSDQPFVSTEYGRELTAARRQAMEVERVSDDPPERVQAWVSTVAEPALEQLDLEMLLDLLRIEGVLAQWEPVAAIAASDAERRTLAGDAAGARLLVEAIVRETKTDGRPALRASAARIVERLCAGPIARHVGLRFRTVPDGDAEHLVRLCQLLGPGLVRSLADALAKEDNDAAIRRLGALLLGFGAAGRRSVEQLKNSSNPAVRRTAITLLRTAGGPEALTELASMLGDADPEVQRESIRAIVEIGTTSAYAVLYRLLVEADRPRDTALKELLHLRDEKAVPLFCYVLGRSQPRGRLVNIHVRMIEALGVMKPRPESIRTLQQVLTRGDWWAPFRTATIRQAAAAALRRLGTPEAMAALESAAATGRRGVRKVARAQIAGLARREKSRT